MSNDIPVDKKPPQTIVEDDYFHTSVVDKPYLTHFRDQLWVMLIRNYTLQKRYWKSTLSQTLFAPFLVMILLFGLQQADYANQLKTIPHPPIYDLQGVYRCDSFAKNSACINLMYFPATEPFISVLSSFSSKNALRTGEPALVFSPAITSLTAPSSIIDMAAVQSPDFIYQYVLANQNTTAYGVTFNISLAPTNIQYQIWYNNSQTTNGTDIFGTQLVALMRGLDEAIISVLNNKAPVDYTVRLKDWPLIPSGAIIDNIVQSLGPTFFFSSIMIIFINVLNQIVSEKELKLRHGMEVMGLKPSIYWISNFISISGLVFINSLATIIFGLIFGFAAFRNCNFFVLFFTFFLFGESMVMFAFFVTTFIKKSNAAVLFGIFMFIIGLLFESFVFGNGLLGYIWYDMATSSIARNLLMFLPFFNFGRMFLDITTMSSGIVDSLTDSIIAGPGFGWSSLYSTIPQTLLNQYQDGYPDVPIPAKTLYYFIMNICFYAVLTWYFDNVIPDEFGVSKKFYFFATRNYWKTDKGSAKILKEQIDWVIKSNLLKHTIADVNEDVCVSDERMKAKSSDFIENVKIINLRKTFKPSIFSRVKENVAVKNLSITFEEGKLFALLGQNGAGKTTTINMLSGLTIPTSGDALINNLSVVNQMPQIRKNLGICPQHDILFDDLTAREHIELYAGLKGVPRHQWNELVESRLKAVRLLAVADKVTCTYSGGMKRRLSVVISTLGDPKVVFMDEPTTGMDPVNRRHVWAFIQKFKKGRVVVLTTHSMEEADVLSDRIGIMVKGELRAIGNSISLKSKFGAGYRIYVVTDVVNIARVKAIIESNVKGAILEDDSAGSLIYQFSAESSIYIPILVKLLEANSEGLYNSWSLGQSTLEEVFLKVIRSDH